MLYSRSLLLICFILFKEFKIFYLFIFDCAGSCSLCTGFLLQRTGSPLCCNAWASHCSGWSCGAQAIGVWASVVTARGLDSCSSWAVELRLISGGLTGLVVPQHVESPWTRDQTHVFCIGRWIFFHCTTREVLVIYLKFSSIYMSITNSQFIPPCSPFPLITIKFILWESVFCSVNMSICIIF